MYLAAQHVQSLLGNSGVNTVLYTHDDTDAVNWDAPDLERIANESPGRIVATRYELQPGGNSVLSYLDLVAADSQGLEHVALALEKLHRSNRLQAGETAVMSGVFARFVLATRQPRDLDRDRESLVSHALDLLRSHDPPTVEVPAPLLVHVDEEAEGLRLVFARDSVVRLQGIHGQEWTPATLGASREILEQMARHPTNVFPQLALVLTELDLDGIARLGGISFVRGEKAEPMWRWPSAEALVGYCLNCHRHGTLRAADRSAFICAVCANEQDTDGLWATALS